MQMADGVGVPPRSENKALDWQTCRQPLIEGQRLFSRVANRKAGDPPPNKAAASTDIEGGGKESGSGGDLSQADFYRSLPILATHYGLEVGR